MPSISLVDSAGVLRLVSGLPQDSALRLNLMNTQADNNGSGSSIDKRGLAAAYRFLAGRRSVFALTANYEPFGLAPVEAAVPVRGPVVMMSLFSGERGSTLGSTSSTKYLVASPRWPR